MPKWTNWSGRLQADPDQLAVVRSEADAAATVLAARKRGQTVRVGGAFHSPAMRPAVPGFCASLARAEIQKGSAPVFYCITCAPFDDVPYRLAQALVSSVRWRETLLALQDAGAHRFLEPGPGTTLAGLVRRCLTEAEVVPPEELEPASA